LTALAVQGPFEGRIEEWNRKLSTVSEVLEAWLAVQRNWLYLQPIFESPDINKQLPTEGKKFSIVDKNWRMTISSAKGGVTKVSATAQQPSTDRAHLLLVYIDKTEG
jgi:dynein heavy chain